MAGNAATNPLQGSSSDIENKEKGFSAEKSPVELKPPKWLKLKAEVEASDAQRKLQEEVGVAAEVRKRDGTLEMIDEIDPDKDFQTPEGRARIERMNVIMFSLVGAAYGGHMPREKIVNFDTFLQQDFSSIATNEPQRKLIERLKAFFATNPESQLMRYYRNDWEKFAHYLEAPTARAQVLTGKRSPKNKDEKPTKEEKTVWNTIKDNWKTIAIGGGIALGVYAVWNMFRSTEEKSSGEATESSLWKWTKRFLWVGGGVGAVTLLSMYFTGAKNPKELWEMLKLWLDGKSDEAKLISEEGKEAAEHYAEIAKKISAETNGTVSAPTVAAIGKIPYVTYTGMVGQGISAVKEFGAEAAENLGVGGKYVLSQFVDIPKEQTAKEEKLIRGYLEKKKNEIERFNLSEDATVLTVLEHLTGTASIGEKLEEERAQERIAEHAAAKKIEEASAQQSDPLKQSVAHEVAKFLGQHTSPPQKYKEFIDQAVKKKIDVKEALKHFHALERAHAEFEFALSDPATDPEILVGHGVKLAEAYDALKDSTHDLAKKMLRFGGVTHAVYLAALQGLHIGASYLAAPHLQKEMAKYYAGKILKAPFRGVTVDRAKPEHFTEWEKHFQTKITEADQELAKLDHTKAGRGLSGPEKMQYDGFRAEKDVAEAELTHLRASHKLAQKEQELLTLKNDFKAAKAAGNASLATSLEGKISSTEKFVHVGRVKVSELELKVAVAKTGSLEHRMSRFADDLDHELTRTPILKSEQLYQLDEFEREIAATHKVLEREIKRRVELLADVRAGKLTGYNAATLENELNDLLKNEHRISSNAIRGIDKFSQTVVHYFRSIRAKFKGLPPPQITKMQETAYDRIRRLMKDQLKYHSDTFGNIMNKIPIIGKCITIFGVALKYGAAGAAGAYLRSGETKIEEGKIKEIGTGKLIGQAALDVAPGIGTVSDFYSAWSGEEYITEQKLDATDRVIRGAFGVAGLLTFGTLPSIVKGINMIRKGAKFASQGERLKAMVEAAKQGKKTFEVTEAGKWLKKARTTGIAIGVGGALGKLGYDFIYTPEEIDLSDEMQEVLGDTLERVQKTPLTE